MKGVGREESGDLLHATLLDLRGVQRYGKREKVDGSIDDPSCWRIGMQFVTVPGTVQKNRIMFTCFANRESQLEMLVFM